MDVRAAACIFLLAIAGCTEAKAPRSESRLKVTVPIGGKTGQVNGVVWPKDDEELIDTWAIEEPLDISIQFPWGAFASYSRCSFLSHMRGRITEVEILPLEKPVTLKDAIRIAGNLADRLGTDVGSAFRECADHWTDTTVDADVFTTLTTRVPLRDHFEVYFEIKLHSSGSGWFIVLTIQDCQNRAELNGAG